MELLLFFVWVFALAMGFRSHGIMMYVWFIASAYLFSKLIHPWLYAQLAELYASIPTP